jgi:hypothetical protein
MDLDDQQQFRHAIKILVSCANIVREEVQKLPFSDEQAERMVLAYWNAQIASSFAPDFGGIMKGMFGQDE